MFSGGVYLGCQEKSRLNRSTVNPSTHESWRQSSDSKRIGFEMGKRKDSSKRNATSLGEIERNCHSNRHRQQIRRASLEKQLEQNITRHQNRRRGDCHNHESLGTEVEHLQKRFAQAIAALQQQQEQSTANELQQTKQAILSSSSKLNALHSHSVTRLREQVEKLQYKAQSAESALQEEQQACQQTQEQLVDQLARQIEQLHQLIECERAESDREAQLLRLSLQSLQQQCLTQLRSTSQQRQRGESALTNVLEATFQKVQQLMRHRP